MAAYPHVIRLYEGKRFRRQDTKHVDPASVKALRATLIELIETHRGDADVDLSKWHIVVHQKGSLRRICKFTVTDDGLDKRTEQ